MFKNRKTLFGCSALLLLVAITAGYLLFCPIAKEQREGIFGYVPHPEETSEFVASLPTPTIRDADPNIFRGDKVDTFLYRALAKSYKETYGVEWVPHNQGIGDCVSHGWGLAIDISLAIDYDIGKVDEFKECSTEAIYGGSRVEARGAKFGGWSDGSYGGAAAKWVVKSKNIGGVIFREIYGDLDLRKYNSSLAKNWGNYGCGGQNDNGELDLIARQHPVLDVTLVRNFEEAAAAIQNGYPIAVCSGQGFSSSRDSDGFARASGSWSHCMAFVGVRFGERPGLLCQNSWGSRWIDGPKWPADQPDGSFWVDADTATRMLKGGDSFAISGVEGFRKRDLNHSAWARIDTVVPETHYALAP